MQKTNLTNLKKNKKKIRKSKEEKSIHFAESLFNSRFLGLLKKTMPSGANFLKKKKAERLIVNKKLDQLINEESNWKNVVKKSRLSTQIIKANFGPSLKKFCKDGSNLLFPPVETTSNGRQKFASTKAENFLEGIFEFLISENEITLTGKFDIKSVNFRKISETLDLEHLFALLIRICITNIYRSCMASNDLSEVDLDSTGTGVYLFAKRTNIQYSFNKSFQDYLIVQLLSDLSTNKEVQVSSFNFKIGKNQKLKDEITTKQFGKVKKLIHRKIYKISNKVWFTETFSACSAFLWILEKTPVVLTTLNHFDKEKNKQNKIYQFDSSLKCLLDFSEHLPRIIRPNNQKTNDCLKDLVRTGYFGTSSMKPNDCIRKAANLIQSKCFTINQEYFSILRNCDESIDPKKLSKFPFPTKLEFFDLSQKFQKWGSAQEFKLKFEMHKKLRVMRSKRQLFLTAVDMSDVFSGYPLYYTTKFDYRLRMYPLQFLLSRTTGYLKRTLKDFSPQKLSISGLIHLLQAYYSFNKSQRDIFDQYLEKSSSLVKNLSKKKLQLFFEKNPLNYAGKQFCYSTMLFGELSRIFCSKGKKMTTQIWLEVDQNASAFTFLALLFENEKMARATGLIANSTGSTPDIYSLIRDQIRSYVTAEYKGDFKNTEDLLNFLCSNEESRGLHKMAAMCWVFNEGKQARIRKWLEQFKKLNNRSLSNNEYRLLNWVGKEYPSIVNKIFPNLSKQKDLINQAVKLLIKNSTETEIEVETLDGGLLGWDFHPEVETIKSVWNPVLKKKVSVGQNRAPSLSKKKSLKNENSFKKQKLMGENYRLRKHLSTFIPNLIQSIDGSVLRMLILKVFSKTKYVMNPLHDCFMVTPNSIDALGEAILELYSGPEFGPGLADRLFFKPLSNKKLSGSSRDELNRIRSEFDLLKTPFFVDKATLDPWKLYSYET